MLKSVQEKQGLAIGSRGWLTATSRQKLLVCQACQKLKRHASWSITGQNRTTGRSVTSRLELVTQSSHEAKPRASPVLKNLTLYIPFSPQHKYPFYLQKKESFQREFWERNPREKQDWCIPNLYWETLQIPQLSSSPLLNPWEAYYQNIFSLYPFLWKGCLVLWEAIRKEPISHWLMLWSSSGIREARKKIGSAQPR